MCCPVSPPCISNSGTVLDICFFQSVCFAVNHPQYCKSNSCNVHSMLKPFNYWIVFSRGLV